MSEKTILHNLLYILIFGCLFLYIGLKRSSMSKDKFKQLFLFGIFLIVFFFVKIFIITVINIFYCYKNHWITKFITIFKILEIIYNYLTKNRWITIHIS